MPDFLNYIYARTGKMVFKGENFYISALGEVCVVPRRRGGFLSIASKEAIERIAYSSNRFIYGFCRAYFWMTNMNGNRANMQMFVWKWRIYDRFGIDYFRDLYSPN